MPPDAAPRSPPFPVRSWWTFLVFQVTVLDLFFIWAGIWVMPGEVEMAVVAAGVTALLLLGAEGRKLAALLGLLVPLWVTLTVALPPSGSLIYVLVVFLEVCGVEVFFKIRRRRGAVAALPAAAEPAVSGKEMGVAPLESDP